MKLKVLFSCLQEPAICSYSEVLCNVSLTQGRGVHVTGVSAAYTFKLNKNILSE
jgi:hypothetical protein